METEDGSRDRRPYRRIDRPEGWYFRVREEGHDLIKGPLSEGEIKDLFSRGSIPSHALIRYGQKGDWHPAPDLFPPPPKKRGRCIWAAHLLLPLIFAVFLAIAITRDNAGVVDPLTFPFWKGAEGKGSPLPALDPLLPSGKASRLPAPETPEPALTRQRMILWTNEARAQQMLLPLTQSSLLDMIAAERVNDIFQRQYFAHISPTGEGVADTARKLGYRYRLLAENIAKGAFHGEQRVVQGLLQSPGHRKNLLSEDVEELGAAVGKGSLNGEVVWVAVQVFGKPSPPLQDRASPGGPAGESGSACKRPNAYMVSRIEALRTEIGTGRKELAAAKAEMEIKRKAFLAQARKSEKPDDRLAAEYNSRTKKYGLLAEEIRRKDQLARDMIARYNSDVEKYNTCRRN